MLNKIIDFSIRNKLIVCIFILALVGYGAYELKRLPIDAVPDITNNQVQVITIAPALAAPEIERLITFPIEQFNNNIPGLKEIRSFSRFGLSVVTIVFDDNTDVYWARQQITERLAKAQERIPKGFGTPTLAPVTTGLGEIYQYTVRPKKGYESKYNAMELRTIQDWIVRRQLLSVQGVAEVSSFGGLLKQYEIAVDPNKLMANNITIGDVFQALEKNNANTGGAYIEKGPTVLFIRSEGLAKNKEDLKNIVVKNLPNGTPLMISDVGEVGFGSATRYGAMTYNGVEQVSGAVVMMLKGANSNVVIKNIKNRIEQIQKTLPEGVVIDPFLDRTKMVNNSINTVSQNLMEGALIVVFVLVLFLGNLRAGLIVASVIPLSMLFAVIMMNIFGVSGNLMSLGALDFGLIVDGAVIIVESVMHQLSFSHRFKEVKKLSQGEMDNEVSHSASRMMNSAVFGQIIILIVYLPIFSLQGIEGKMFKPMAQTVAFALIGAFVLSLTYIPMLSAYFLSKKRNVKRNFSEQMMSQIENFYQPILEKALKVPKLILVSAVLLFVLAVFVLTKLGGEFIPSLPEGDYAVETRVLPGSNLNTSIEAVSKGSRIILEKFPEVEKIVGKTGSSEVPTDPMPIDATDMMIILKDRSKWTSAKTYEELESKMSKELEAVAGVKFGFQYPVAMRFNELISGARQDVVCKIFGENLDTLAMYANKLGNICNSVNGSSGLYVEAVTGMPQIVIDYDRPALAQYGLNINDINRTVNAAFAGEISGTVYEGEKSFDLVVRLANNKRKDLEDVQNLLVETPNGTQIPIKTVAKIDIIEGPNQIQRENSQRRIIVGFNVRGRDVQTMVTELQKKVDQQIKLPPGYYITYGGAFENLQEAKNRLMIAVPLSLFLIFLMLYFTFRSIKFGLLIYSAIPLSAIGGIFALAVRGMPFSISAGVGFIALFGVAVLNGIVLISEFNRLQKDGMTDLKQIVVEGTKLRLRPVLMTALVASLGFLPMALSSGEGAEVQKPLATVVIGGLLIATLLTLFLLPILYIMFQKGFSFSKKTIHFIILSVIFIGSTMVGNAQTPISLKSAIDTAIKNNLSLQNERLRAEYRQKLIPTSKTIPVANFMSDYGQINSIYTDTKIGVTQTVNFPKVYQTQFALLTEEWKSSLLNVSVKEAALKKQVMHLYSGLIYIKQKELLLRKNDTLFTDFFEKSALRFKKGESNVLEKTSAENQRGQIAIQLAQVEQDKILLQMQLQWLLNTNIIYTPSDTTLTLNNDVLKETFLFSELPILQLLKQQQKVAVANTKVEKAKLLPDFTFGYNIMSMKGMGADNKEYQSVPRFQSLQVGLGIPIFTSGQRARINATKFSERIASNDYEMNQQQLFNAYKSALADYRKFDLVVRYFETTALNNAQVIAITANKQFLIGEINYLEWMILVNQSITLQSDYIEALKNRNTSIIELNSFNTK